MVPSFSPGPSAMPSYFNPWRCQLDAIFLELISVWRSIVSAYNHLDLPLPSPRTIWPSPQSRPSGAGHKTRSRCALQQSHQAAPISSKRLLCVKQGYTANPACERMRVRNALYLIRMHGCTSRRSSRHRHLAAPACAPVPDAPKTPRLSQTLPFAMPNMNACMQLRKECRAVFVANHQSHTGPGAMSCSAHAISER